MGALVSGHRPTTISGPAVTQPPTTTSHYGADCAFDSTTVGLGLTMQVKGGALLGWHVVAVTFAQL